MLSKEEGQPGTPEKPLSDLGRVSYYSYWKSMVLEYLDSHRTDNIDLTIISKETGMYCQDIALALQLLGFIKYVPADGGGVKVTVCVDWKTVDKHAEKVAKSKIRIYIDLECLRWKPLLSNAASQFREERSDGENNKKSIETSANILPVPEKIIIENTQGVKLKRGKKRKVISAFLRAPKTPKAETPKPVTVPIETATETPSASEEFEITSSGRKRTRPSKFNETTYADVKPSKYPIVVDNKRKRSENDVEKEVMKKSKPDNTEHLEASSIVKETSTVRKELEPATSNRLKKTSTQTKEKVVGERWSQRRAKKQKELEECQKKEDEKLKRVGVGIENTEQDNSCLKQHINISEELNTDPATESDASNTKLDYVDTAPALEILSTPQIKKKKPVKKRRSWNKSRARSNVEVPKNQPTLPQMIKAKQQQKESETDSVLSEKSDDERFALVKSENILSTPVSSVDKLEKKRPKKTSRISTEEDSSAEADDEMENDELPTHKESSPIKYKYPRSTPTKDELLKTPPKNRPSKDKGSPNKNISPKLGDADSKSVIYSSTTSESETEIDGQKIKTISSKKMLELSKNSSFDFSETTKEEEPVPKPNIMSTSDNKINENPQKLEETLADNTAESFEEKEKLVPQLLKPESARMSVDMEIEKMDDSQPIIEQEHATAKSLIISSKIEEIPKIPDKQVKVENQVQISEVSYQVPQIKEIQNVQDIINASKLPDKVPKHVPESTFNSNATSTQSDIHISKVSPIHSDQQKSVATPEKDMSTCSVIKTSQPPVPATESTVIITKNIVTASTPLESTMPCSSLTNNEIDSNHSDILNSLPLNSHQTVLANHTSSSMVAKTNFQQPNQLISPQPLERPVDKKEHTLVLATNPEPQQQLARLEPQIFVSKSSVGEPTPCKPIEKTEDLLSVKESIENPIVKTVSCQPKVSLEKLGPLVKEHLIVPPITVLETKSVIEKPPHKDIKTPLQSDYKHIEAREPIKPKEEHKVSPKQEPVRSERTKQEKYDDKRYPQKIPYEDKLPYDAAQKVHMENEALLAASMASQGYHMNMNMTAQYPWQWDRFWSNKYYDPTKREYPGYAMPPLQFPLDMLPTSKQSSSCEKEKSSSKSHRYDSKYSQQNNTASNSGSNKSSKSEHRDKSQIPRKEEKSKHKLEQESSRTAPEQYKASCSVVNNASNMEHKQQCAPPGTSNNLTSPPKALSKPKDDSHKVESHENLQQQTTVKQPPPTQATPDIPSMGVYTPDSTTNSVHSLPYAPCELDVSHIGLESPASISSDMASQNSVDVVRPSSAVSSHSGHGNQQPPQTNYDCMQQQNLQAQGVTIPASSPGLNSTMQIQQPSPQQSTSQSGSSKRQIQQQRNRSNTPSSKQHNMRATPPNAAQQTNTSSRQRATPPSGHQHQHNMQVSPSANNSQHQVMQQQHQQQLQQHLHQQVAAAAVHQGYSHQLATSAMHQHAHHGHHSVISQANYIPVATTQGFSGQSTSTYVNVPMTTVIQHRMTQQGGISPLSSLGPGHQNLSASPSCAVTTGTSFYIQSNPHSHTPGPTVPTPSPNSLQTNTGQPASGNASCSLAKLQQMVSNSTIPPSSCNTMTPPPTSMTPPTHHPHTMTPPPSHQAMIQNQTVRNLTPPSGIPSNLQQQVLGYHKYYQTNMNVNQLSGTVTPPIGQNLGRSGRNSAPNVAAMQHMQTSSSRVSPNVSLNPYVMNNSLNGYRITPQQAPSAVTGYITNTPASFINNQIPTMQMMNMAAAQTQYQDPAALQRAQQNTMYTYNYINGIMRR